MITEWRELLKQVEVRGDIFEFTSEVDLLEFEGRTGIFLPSKYKEFCQIFGSGEFGNDLLNIHVVSHDNLLSMIEWTSELRVNLELDIYLDDLTMAKLEVIRNHLKSALIFGGNGKSQFCFWDLTTYDKLDDSYDIYLASWGSYDCCQVGRDFFTFVKDFCLGMKPYEYLPEGLLPDDTSIFFRIRFSPEYEATPSSWHKPPTYLWQTEPEAFFDYITPMIRRSLEDRLSAEDISYNWAIPLEVVRQAIDRLTGTGGDTK